MPEITLSHLRVGQWPSNLCRSSNLRTNRNYLTRILTRCVLDSVVGVDMSFDCHPRVFRYIRSWCMFSLSSLRAFKCWIFASLEKFIPFSQVRAIPFLFSVRFFLLVSGQLLLNCMSYFEKQRTLIEFFCRHPCWPGCSTCIRCIVRFYHICVYALNKWHWFSPQEREIIDCGYSCYVLGRSGTGWVKSCSLSY